MSVINHLYLQLSGKLLRRMDKSKTDPFPFQERCLPELIANGKDTFFGKEHRFDSIRGIKDFQRNIPVRDYNAFTPYITRLRQGEHYILWNQRVKWFARSSGTSSDKSKFIPVTPDSLYINHYGGFKRMLASYIRTYPDSKIFNGKALTLGGSFQPDEASGGNAFYGDLSAILLKNSPALVEMIRTPQKKTALTGDFSRKIELICRESSRQNVTNFSGVPSWNLILINKILEYTGKKYLTEVWPRLELFMHGGIGFEPYREIYKTLIPSPRMHYVENYNASEGYFAFQDDPATDSMLLTLDNGIFYEFIPMEMLDGVMEDRIREIPTLREVSTGVNYAMVISTCGGLWRYLIGDCVKFTSLRPYRIRITGRTQLYINAFGEELMIENAERALARACRTCNCRVEEFTVAPVFMELTGQGNTATKGYHKWAIEFAIPPQDIACFEKVLDEALTCQNSDYEAKRKNNATMEQLRISVLPRGTFYRWMESKNKLGGQNKVPRLSTDSRFIDQLEETAKRYNFI